MQERDNLVEMAQNFEGQFKESHSNMQQALSRVQELEKELEEKAGEFEDIRDRVTQVAELFEKKEIKQKYSFEVLCDFIHDKAKRLYTKYETVSRERKVMQEEKNFYFQRKLDQLEQENMNMKENVKIAERIIHEIIPSLSQLLERPLMQNQELSDYYFAKHVLE